MSTYSTAGVAYGQPLGTYGDLEHGDVPAESAPVPTPTFAVGAVGRTTLVGSSARTLVAGSSGRSTVSGPPGTTLTVGRVR